MTDKEIAIVKDVVSELKAQLKKCREAILIMQKENSDLRIELARWKDPAPAYELKDRVELELKLLDK